MRCPVLVGLGERDVLVDPRGELRAYESASSVDFFVCPRMAHMHNFAGTRELFWRRIETWAEWVRACGTRRRTVMDLELAEDLDLAADARAGRPRPLPRAQRQLRPAPDPLRRAGGGAVPHRRGGHRRGRTASRTRCTATSCGRGAATCRSSSRWTATGTAAPSRPATSWRCRTARSSSPWSRRSMPRARRSAVFDDAPRRDVPEPEDARRAAAGTRCSRCARSRRPTSSRASSPTASGCARRPRCGDDPLAAPGRAHLPLRHRHGVRPAGRHAGRSGRAVDRPRHVVPGEHPGRRLGAGRPATGQGPQRAGLLPRLAAGPRRACSAPRSTRSSCCCPDR